MTDPGGAIELRAPTPESTREVGAVVGRHAPDGAVVLLIGSLGAGKTTFAQGVAVGCGVTDRVASPTYNLVLHHAGDRPFTHVDLYRLSDDAELDTLDLDEFLAADGVTCVEWPERIAGLVPPPRASVRMAREADGTRAIAVELEGPGWERLGSALADHAVGAAP